jgi:hypothetical protein
MTEAEWLACADAYTMLEFLRNRTSNRKLRLLSCACARKVWNYIVGATPEATSHCRRAVELTELSADGPIDLDELRSIDTVGITDDAGLPEEPYRTAFMLGGHVGWNLFFGGLEEYVNALNTVRMFERVYLIERRFRILEEQPAPVYDICGNLSLPEPPPLPSTAPKVVRDIFGNPFRPLPPRPEAIAPLAEQIYAGAWDQMPILGEWLQEHGYWSEGEHCLDPSIQHVKGCWVVDWVTGRE